ncbi:agmatine deiminase family protein [Idiomarina seosinensis]|uniref:Agmatine deiminase family protein n=1 Tax=Idiomarina seosinensis TaxID=281739 RepID=A0A432ZJ81_9GAMM|nr:agmatine deiminase family protein [Idiomarina seosinensis]RUO77963.1 agmatine deiminase family protein [Idiomarina seosinensis]
MRRWFKEYSAGQVCLLAEPYRSDVWRKNGEPAQARIKQLQQSISQFQPCSILPSTIGYDDIWLRDTLPLWHTIETCPEAADWRGWQPRFNGWGGVQSAYDKDATLATRLFKERVISQSFWVAENGTFSHNGEWLLIGFNSIKSRNPQLNESQLKRLLADTFEPLKPIFIETQLVADETGGHIDNLVLFVNDNTVIYSATNEPQHPDFVACQQLEKQLQELPDSINKIALPLPSPQPSRYFERCNITHSSGSLARTTELPLLCSYVNCIVLNQALIVPQYDLPEDQQVLERLQKAVPDTRMIPFNARELVLGGGGLHCVSYQLPLALAPLVNADVPCA